MTRIHKKNKQKKNSGVIKFLVIAGILLISTLLIVFKTLPDQSGETSAVFPNAVPTLVPTQANEVAIADESLEERLDRLILAKEPVFAFFHSNNCQLCLEMIDIVKEVYPDYQAEIELVDINVYDEMNKNLLARANIHSIPTQIFFNESGEAFQSIGLMSAEQLRDSLDKLAGKE